MWFFFFNVGHEAKTKPGQSQEDISDLVILYLRVDKDFVTVNFVTFECAIFE